LKIFKMAKILFRIWGGRICGKELSLGHVFCCINLGRKYDNWSVLLVENIIRE